MFIKNIQFSKSITQAEIKINNKDTLILAADNKQNYPEREIQEIKQNIAIDTEIASNKIKTKNNKI